MKRRHSLTALLTLPALRAAAAPGTCAALSPHPLRAQPAEKNARARLPRSGMRSRSARDQSGHRMNTQSGQVRENTGLCPETHGGSGSS